MRALIRNPGENVTEEDGIAGIDWNTGTPLTNAAWCGGPYHLVQNYVPPTENGPEIYEPVPEPEPEIIPDGVEIDLNDIVMINGVAYTKAQLREMLGE